MHIGIIPDGNRRWAKQSGTSPKQGYAIGFFNGIDLGIHLHQMGARQITFFGLSADNYRRRSPEQLEAIISQITDSMSVANYLLMNRGIRVRFFGDINRLADCHRQKFAEIEAAASTVRNPNAMLNILVNYDFDWDLCASPGQLATRDIPACDLVVRSGGMMRLSGFLPRQSAGAELFFTRKLWPDVRKADVNLVMSRFHKARRNFGA